MAVDNRTLKKFADYFSGNEDYYVQQAIDIKKVLVANKKKVKPETKAYYVDSELTLDAYEKHLQGDKALGVCNIDNNNQVVFGCIDIDYYKDSAKLLNVIRAVYTYSLPLIPCRSKSGGLHLFLFLQKPENAADVKAMLEKISKLLFLVPQFTEDGVSKVEVFPDKASVSNKKGHSITLPYFNACSSRDATIVTYGIKSDNSVMDLDAFIETAPKKFTTLVRLEEFLQTLPLSDAPICLQSLLISNTLKGGSGRNNFIYSVAVYMRKKHGDDEFPKFVREINDELPEPLEAKDVEDTIKSASNKEGFYKCKSLPCIAACDKKICATREFGLGMNKGHFTGIDFGSLIRVKSVDPYYIWELRAQENAPFTRIIFKDEDEILTQRIFIKRCVRYLNTAPFLVKENEWLITVNTALKNIKEEAVTDVLDTTEGAKVRRYFLRYLTQSLCASHAPYLIKLGNVYQENDKYYFLPEHFQSFLDSKRVKYDIANMAEQLKIFGCVQGELKYTTKTGTEKSIPCWIKVADEALTSTVEELEEVLKEDTAFIEAEAKLEKAKTKVDLADLDDEEEEATEF